LISKDIIRVYAASLDEAQIGRVGYIDLDARDPRKVLAVSQTPCLDIGAPGCFDDHGVSPTAIVRDGDAWRLYYTGWQLSSTIRYYLLTGLAISHDGGQSFQRTSQTPMLERSNDELTVRTAPCLLFDHDVWKMWYIAGSSTIIVDDKQVPTYEMRYLESTDGLKWGSCGQTVMSPTGDDEYGFGRPCVVKKAAGYEMWYSVRTRSRGYHLGYATSEDGLSWQRQDHLAEFSTEPEGWDSKMQAFGTVVDSAFGRYIFYNGNEYGRTGFGAARWVEPQRQP